MSEKKLHYPKSVLALAENDPQLQSLMPVPDDAEDSAKSLQALIEGRLTLYADRAAIGVRDYEIGRDPDSGCAIRTFLPRYHTISYGEIHDRIKRLAAIWTEHPQHRIAPGELVCILGFSGADYTVVDLACAYAQAVSVPLQVTLGDELGAIFDLVTPAAVAATMEDLARAVELSLRHPSIRSIIAFDYDVRVDDDRDQFAAAQAMLKDAGGTAALIVLDDLIARTTSDMWHPLPPDPEGLERMAALIHSSGSTGTPKGAIITERLAETLWASTPAVPVVRVAYAPMNHMLGRGMINSTLARGGTVYITAKPDLSELFDDIRLARPTELPLIPRLLETIYDHFRQEVARRSATGEPAARIEAEVMNEMRDGFLGDRIRLLSCSSAPTTQEVKQFMVDCFQLPLNESYGLTEAGAVMADGQIRRPPIIDYRLRDVPELGYYTSDKPFPRGELCLRSETAIPGYYKQPTANAKLFDQDGYLLTGDIMEERAPDHLVYLERANDVLKLSQGEFVAIGALGVRLENRCSSIHQIYVYGNSARPYLLAVIVPDMSEVHARLGSTPDEAALRSFIRSELKEAAAAENLRAVEIPRDFLIELEPFSFENGLLTSVKKRKRPALKARYRERLEQLYEDIEQKQRDELKSLREDSGLSVEEKLIRALEASLGIEDVRSSLTSSFSQLGGDSLAAASFSSLISEIFGVEVSVNSILSPAGNVGMWARSIERALHDDEDGQPTYATVHGDDTHHLNAEDLAISAFMGPKASENAALDPPTEPARCVLLTGATGFLGRFLCLEWLQRMEQRGGKLICLIRANSAAAARERLSAGFASDPALASHFAALADRHLEIVVGDVAERQLGLDQATFQRLAQEVDHVVHCGALVNHVLPYAELFGPNVVGTAQLIQLALTHRQKGFDFISTIGVVAFLEPDDERAETTPLLRSIPLRNSHAAGYSTSKWSAEQLLRSANELFGLPVNIFRCNMILAHRHYAGQINVPDSFTRLLYSLVMTETAPESFYEIPEEEPAQHPYYDGLPVDFVAAAITGIGDVPARREVQTFHVVTPHIEDGASLDMFAEWIEEAGYRLDRFAGYSEWLERFEAKLRALPEGARQRSMLPVLASAQSPIKRMIHMGGAKFVEAVHEVTGQPVPRLDRNLVRKYLSDLQQLELIPEVEVG